MIRKSEKHFMFEVQLNWTGEKKGILSTQDAAEVLNVATPPKFGGEGSNWSPEHFFLGAISSCFMTTYLAFAEKAKLNITGLSCEIIGQIEIVNGAYKFTTIDLYPKIHIPDEDWRTLAGTLLDKTHKYCLISNSVNATIYYHSEVIVSPGIKDPGTSEMQTAGQTA